jgi:hypothetical protein
MEEGLTMDTGFRLGSIAGIHSARAGVAASLWTVLDVNSILRQNRV